MDCLIKWNYVNTNNDSSGYKDELDELKNKYSNENYMKLSDEEREAMSEEVFQIYRSKNIFPITYYTDKEVHKEIEKCINKNFAFEGNLLNHRFNQGSSLLKWMFPNSNNTFLGTDNRTMLNKFYTDHTLRRAINFALKYDKHAQPARVQGGLRMIGGSTTTNFKAMHAKALCERYCPEGGTVYDFSCGFGGRMLGALSSKNNYKYIGVEPCVETYDSLLRLGNYIEEVTGRNDSYEIHNVGSEEFFGEAGSVDFAFSSPPYFNLEKYSDEPTQCYNKYPVLDEWFEGYVKKTIQNTYDMLKDGGVYAVNIADFKTSNKQVNYVDEWIRMSEEIGFTFKEQLHMRLQSRGKDRHTENGQEIERKEGIFVFTK